MVLDNMDTFILKKFEILFQLNAGEFQNLFDYPRIGLFVIGRLSVESSELQSRFILQIETLIFMLNERNGNFQK